MQNEATVGTIRILLEKLELLSDKAYLDFEAAPVDVLEGDELFSKAREFAKKAESSLMVKNQWKNLLEKLKEYRSPPEGVY